MTGDLTITGTMTAATKSFDIKHPDPDKIDHRLRHWCIESDKPGGMVMYTRSVEMSTTSETFNMPDWFKHLTKDVIVFVTPFKHFGSGWGECIDNELQIHTTTKGQWNVLITASRNDHCAINMCPKEVEYTTAPIIEIDEEKQSIVIIINNIFINHSSLIIIFLSNFTKNMSFIVGEVSLIKRKL